ncbi:hypothetical protein EHQ76_07490 [Leptospira barantonii]|uniref:Uncharacterized protein n=1 Tax=Leptospira barantonii TaxID=2023184 RepID=A0A5F2BHK1_9LEPT|nr:hypothetical protein [Leptospira barantonii]TGM04877.1 hypothetical protein EHQ76_07490 [Leptospira barantonii]
MSFIDQKSKILTERRSADWDKLINSNRVIWQNEKYLYEELTAHRTALALFETKLSRINYTFHNLQEIFEVTIRIPESLKESIESAKRILDLEEDWDGEGSTKYDPKTLKIATNLIIHTCNYIERDLNSIFPVPKFLPGPSSSIDIHWENMNFELLLNLKLDSNYFTFYGDNRNENKIKGSFEISRFKFLSGIILSLSNI